jgi:hypothetical protein
MLGEEPPSGGRRVDEIEFDGYCTQARLGKRDGWRSAGWAATGRCASRSIAHALTMLPATDLIPDGEAVVLRQRLDDWR